MRIAIDFDGTIVEQDHAYDDLESLLHFVPGAYQALHNLKRADHVLILWSARANLALRFDWRLNPLWAYGVEQVDPERWDRNRELHCARLNQMLRFVDEELPGVFDAVDLGFQGKPSADLFIDDRALRLGPGGAAGAGWDGIAQVYGEPDYGAAVGPPERAAIPPVPAPPAELEALVARLRAEGDPEQRTILLQRVQAEAHRQQCEPSG